MARRKRVKPLHPQALGERVLFPTDKDRLHDRKQPLTAAQRRALMCWAES